MYNLLTITSNTSNINLSDKFNFESLDVCVSTGDIECFSNINNNVKIKTSTENISLNGLSCKNFELSTSTGEIDINNVTCCTLYSTGSTGDVFLNNVLATEKINITRSTGCIYLDGCDAKDIYIKTSTGDINGSLLSEKIFLVKSNTKKPIIPSTTNGGICELITNTGDINIKIK